MVVCRKLDGPIVYMVRIRDFQSHELGSIPSGATGNRVRCSASMGANPVCSEAAEVRSGDSYMVWTCAPHGPIAKIRYHYIYGMLAQSGQEQAPFKRTVEGTQSSRPTIFRTRRTLARRGTFV